MTEPQEPHVVIHTDGACSGNPGPGGWGAILAFGNHEKELKGGEAHTTNNRMELMAAISALEALKRPCLVDIHTDSQYLRNGIMSWINKWKRNGWRTADKKPVKNIDLWQRLDALLTQHRVRWHWVKGNAMRSTSAPTSWRATDCRRRDRGQGAGGTRRRTSRWPAGANRRDGVGGGTAGSPIFVRSRQVLWIRAAAMILSDAT